MGVLRQQAVAVTTAADGSATEYSTDITGRICMIEYAKTDFANGVDFAITLETSGRGLWTEANVNASTYRNPHDQAHWSDGVGLNYNDESDELVIAPIYSVGERVKIVIAQGGDTKSGTFKIVYEDMQ